MPQGECCTRSTHTFPRILFLPVVVCLAVGLPALCGEESSGLAKVVRPKSNEKFERYPYHIVVKLSDGVAREDLFAWLNGQEITALFRPPANGELVAEVGPEDGLQEGRNTLYLQVWGKAGKPEVHTRKFSANKGLLYDPDHRQHDRRADFRSDQFSDDGDDAGAGSRGAPESVVGFSGDAYAGCQLDTRQSFGNGLYIVEGWAADGPVISSWFLDAIEPDPVNFASIEPHWRWSEVDWEFVPYSSSQPREYVHMGGTLPNPTVTTQRSDWANTTTGCPSAPPVSGEYDDNEFARAVTSNWNRGAQTRTPNDPKQATPNTTITTTGFTDLVALTTFSDLGALYGFTLNPNYGAGAGPKYWWSQAHPSFRSTWPDPCSLPSPPSDQLKRSVAINVFRMPPGALTRTGSGLTSTVLPDIDQGQLPGSQPKPGAMTNQSFAWSTDADAFNPYTGWHTYTILVLSDSVSFYIDAPEGGTDLLNATPVRRFSRTDADHPYPSLAGFGRNMTGADLLFQDYADVKQPLGNLRFMLNNWIDGQGWSGPQPPPTFTGAYAYVKRMRFVPLAPGAEGADPCESGVLDVDFSTWTQETAKYERMRLFHSEYAGNPQFANTLHTNPNMATWGAAPDGTKALVLGLVPIAKGPAVDYFVLSPGGTQGNPSNFVAAEISVPGSVYTTAAFPSNDVFWGPVNQDLPVKVWLVDDPSKTCTCKIKLKGDGTWEVTDVSGKGCVGAFGAKGHKGANNTIGIGVPNF